MVSASLQLLSGLWPAANQGGRYQRSSPPAGARRLTGWPGWTWVDTGWTGLVNLGCTRDQAAGRRVSHRLAPNV